MLAQFCATTVLWTFVSARILALVLQLCERNKLERNWNWKFIQLSHHAFGASGLSKVENASNDNVFGSFMWSCYM